MLLLYALARPIASSLSPSSSTNSTSFDPVTGECIDIHGCRTTTGIIWSCLSVIFICTWVAIHPNIPRVHDNKGKPWHPAVLVYQDIELMIVALLAPEFMILWAMRQREQAKKIRDRFKKYRWGMSHGFFVIMGGFTLYDGDKFCGYLWDRDRSSEKKDDIPYEGLTEEYLERIEAYLAKHQRLDNMNESSEKTSESSTPSEIHENPPATNPSENELLNPSYESRTPLEFLVTQGYINLTENEIKDRSHADFVTKSIAVIQTTWFILQVIARAVEGLVITELEIVTVGFAILNFGTYFLWLNKPLRVRHPVKVCWRHQAAKDEEKEDESWLSWLGSALTMVVGYIFFQDPPTDTLEWLLQLSLLPLFISFHLFWLCLQILQDEDDSDLVIPISSRLAKDPFHLYIAVYGIAAFFGAVHCIPWAFKFPTHTEQLLWRISAVAVAVAPVAMGFLHGYMSTFWEKYGNWNWKDTIVFTLIIVLSITYAVFRVTLIVIAFTSLRDLSPSAYQTVQWTTFFPHIG